MPATFTVDAYPTERFKGMVRQIRNAPTTVQNVVTYDAVIDVDNTELKLKPGMTANATFVYAEKRDVAARAQRGAALPAAARARRQRRRRPRSARRRRHRTARRRATADGRRRRQLPARAPPRLPPRPRAPARRRGPAARRRRPPPGHEVPTGGRSVWVLRERTARAGRGAHAASPTARYTRDPLRRPAGGRRSRARGHQPATSPRLGRPTSRRAAAGRPRMRL